MKLFDKLILKSRLYRDAQEAARKNAEALSCRLTGAEVLVAARDAELRHLRTKLQLITPDIASLLKLQVDASLPEQAAVIYLKLNDLQRVRLRGSHFETFRFLSDFITHELIHLMEKRNDRT